jgi:hypothetical protein
MSATSAVSPELASLPAFCRKAQFFGVGDTLDGATTAVGLASGVAEEANPLFSWAGSGVPIVGMALKFGAKKFLIHHGMAPSTANRRVERVGYAAAGANIATLAGAAMPPALILGLIVGVIADQNLKHKEAECGRLIAEKIAALSAPTKKK